MKKSPEATQCVERFLCFIQVSLLKYFLAWSIYTWNLFKRSWVKRPWRWCGICSWQQVVVFGRYKMGWCLVKRLERKEKKDCKGRQRRRKRGSPADERSETQSKFILLSYRYKTSYFPVQQTHLSHHHHLSVDCLTSLLLVLFLYPLSSSRFHENLISLLQEVIIVIKSNFSCNKKERDQTLYTDGEERNEKPETLKSEQEWEDIKHFLKENQRSVRWNVHAEEYSCFYLFSLSLMSAKLPSHMIMSQS